MTTPMYLAQASVELTHEDALSNSETATYLLKDVKCADNKWFSLVGLSLLQQHAA